MSANLSQFHSLCFKLPRRNYKGGEIMFQKRIFIALPALLLAYAWVAASVAWAAPGEMVWRYQTGDSVVSSPAIATDGTVYAGSLDNYIYAVNPNGSLKWSYETGGKIYSSPAIAPDGTIYAGSYDGYLYALNPEDGTPEWSYPTGERIYSSPAVGTDGTVYVGGLNAYLYAVNTDGTLLWRYETGGRIASSPALAADGTIYVGSLDDHLYAINADGSLKWTFQTGAWIVSSPAVAANGTVYVGSHDYSLYAVNPDGTLRGQYQTGDEIWSSPAIGPDGTVYVGSHDNALYALTAFGGFKWKYETGGAVWSPPAIGPDGAIYVGSNDGYLHTVNSDGTLRWLYETKGDIQSMPAVSSDGIIYVTGADRNLYAVEGDSQWYYKDYKAAADLYAASAWPRFGHDNLGLGRPYEWLAPSLELTSGLQSFPNKTITVPLTLTNNGSVRIQQADMEITFDETLLAPLDISLTEGVLENEAYDLSYEHENGTLILTLGAAGTSLFSGAADGGVVAYLEFEAIGEPGNTSELTFAKADINGTAVNTGTGSVEIVEPARPSLELPADLEIFSGYPLIVPLTLNNSDGTGIEGIDVEIEFDVNVLTGTEVSLLGGVLADQDYGMRHALEDGKMAFHIYGENDLFTKDGIIAYLEFEAVGNPTDSTDITFAKAVINDTDISGDTGMVNASLEVLKSLFEISGNISYYAGNLSPVSNVQMLMEDTKPVGDTPLTLEKTTGTDGNYIFSDVPMGSYMSTPSKTDDLRGLSATDVSKIARYAAGLTELSEYELLAADVTLNGNAGSTDASAVSQYLAGITDDLNPEGAQWIFVPVMSSEEGVSAISHESEREYSPLNSDMENEDFIAIRLGDVTGDWEPGELERSGGTDPGQKRAPVGSMMPIYDISAIRGDILTFPVVLEKEAAIEGIDITLKFDRKLLRPAGVTLTGGILGNRDYLLHHKAGDDEMKILISAASDIFRGMGEVAFVSFEVIRDAEQDPALSLTEFDCNESPARGAVIVNP